MKDNSAYIPNFSFNLSWLMIALLLLFMTFPSLYAQDIDEDQYEDPTEVFWGEDEEEYFEDDDEYYEVASLTHDTVYKRMDNSRNDVDLVPERLKIIHAPKMKTNGFQKRLLGNSKNFFFSRAKIFHSRAKKISARFARHFAREYAYRFSKCLCRQGGGSRVLAQNPRFWPKIRRFPLDNRQNIRFFRACGAF